MHQVIIDPGVFHQAAASQLFAGFADKNSIVVKLFSVNLQNVGMLGNTLAKQ